MINFDWFWGCSPPPQAPMPPTPVKEPGKGSTTKQEAWKGKCKLGLRNKVEQN